MPNRGTHVVVGTLAGLGAAAYVSRNETDPLYRAIQIICGGMGGYDGGALPDELEPAITPLHRGLVHSVALGGGATVAMFKKGEVPVLWAREQVRKLEDELAAAVNGWERFILALAVLAGHAAIGYGVGMAAGYTSHLALDAATPRSLPLLG